MSTLTTEERVALDEIFLSMAVSPSPFGNMKNMIRNVSQSFNVDSFSERAKKIAKAYPMRKSLRSARMFVRSGCKTCVNRFRFKR